MSEQFEARGPFKKRGQFKKSIVRLGVVASALIILGHVAATHAHRFLDIYWLEEAHQAYLTTLVAARNDAWENKRTVMICATNRQQQCVDIQGDTRGAIKHLDPNNDMTVTAWQAYTLSPNAEKIIIAEHPFHSQYIAFNYTGPVATSVLAMGFDADGYSLQPQVYAFELTTVAQLSRKNYRIVVEPSGAVQSLAGRHKTSRVVANHIASRGTPVEG